jgi:hypothetical protein
VFIKGAGIVRNRNRFVWMPNDLPKLSCVLFLCEEIGSFKNGTFNGVVRGKWMTHALNAVMCFPTDDSVSCHRLRMQTTAERSGRF